METSASEVRGGSNFKFGIGCNAQQVAVSAERSLHGGCGLRGRNQIDDGGAADVVGYLCWIVTLCAMKLWLTVTSLPVSSTRSPTKRSAGMAAPRTLQRTYCERARRERAELSVAA